MRSLYLFLLIISLFSLQPLHPQRGEVKVITPYDNVAALQVESNENGFSQSWFQQASGELHKRQYNIKPVEETNSFSAVNVKNQLGFLINPNQLSIKNYQLTPSHEQWQVDLVVSKINQQPIHDKTAIRKEQHSNYLKYSHTDYSIEYINTADGLRQNFIIPSKSKDSAPLTVQLAISGDLTPKLINSNGLAFYASNEPGKVELIYDDLKVWDARNNILPAHMELYNSQELHLVIDDSDAVYPVTIDPLNRAPDWQDGGAGLLFPLLNDLTIPLLYGHSVSGAGDLNNDGFDDIIIGAPAFVEIINVSNGTFNPVSVGAAFIYFGSATGPSLEPNEILQPTTVAGALVGFSVSSAGDLNNDGFDDVIIGAPGDRINLTVALGTVNVAVGKAYIYHGNSFDGNNTTPPTVTASISLRQSDFGVLPTTPANPLYGFSVSHAGDVNNDGFDDIVVGSPTYTDVISLNAVGRSDIYLGSATGS